LDFLFGEGQYGLRFLFAFIVVLGLIGLFAWLVRRFGGTTLGATAARGRQPRLAVIDAAAVDGRRRLLLIRRDNVEHLLMIGGPTDVVVETNIVRAGAMREAAPGRQPAAADTLPRPVPLEETGTWPLQPETAHAQHGTPRRVPLPPDEPNVAWPEEAEPAPMPRQARALDPLAGLAAELSRNPPEPAPAMAALPRVTRPREVTREAPPREPPHREPPLREPPLREPPVREMPPREFAREVPREMPREVPREMAREVHREVGREAVAREAMREPIREVVREPIREAVREPIREAIREPLREAVREPMREAARAPQQAAAEVPFVAAADQNLAEMAHRLEAALRRPGGAKAEARPEPKPRPVAEPAPMAGAGHLEQSPSEARREAKAAPQQRSLYDSLEQEMASLLGRPNSKA
jgi:hypothetical protein